MPTGLSTFEEIRSQGYIYVDKTKHLVNMIDTGKVYFLARPRRFGKSLTVSTFQSLFSGRKDLFQGLYAEEFLNRPEFKPSPVIWLDMSGVVTSGDLKTIEESIKFRTLMAADELKVEVEKTLTSGDMLAKLIAKTSEKYDSKVVFLLDEYDKPYTDLVAKHMGKIWVMELKVACSGDNPAKKADDAFQQMIDKNYALPYPDAVCIAMVIDDAVRQITEYRI